LTIFLTAINIVLLIYFSNLKCVISVKANAVLAGGDAALVEAAFQYGRHIGIAFQLVDDLLDFTSSAEQLGKNQGQGSVSGIDAGSGTGIPPLTPHFLVSSWP
jgi:hypothetical protein